MSTENIFKKCIKACIAKILLMSNLLPIRQKRDPVILLYHRFSEVPTGDPIVIDQETFAWQMHQVSKYCHAMSLSQYISGNYNIYNKRRIVIVTIDDGYEDFYNVAFPVLKEYGLTATFFVTVNFVEHKMWLWPDIIKYILDHSNILDFRFLYNGINFSFDFREHRGKDSAWKALSDYCIQIQDGDKWKLIDSLKEYTRINIPELPTKPFSSVTWDQLREMRNYHIEIGSHTMNHPILSKVEENVCIEEISKSKKILEERLGGDVKTICYPNGFPSDINSQIVEYAKKYGYIGAVLGTGSDFSDNFRLPRVGASTDKADFLWKISGMEFFSSGKYSSAKILL